MALDEQAAPWNRPVTLRLLPVSGPGGQLQHLTPVLPVPEWSPAGWGEGGELGRLGVGALPTGLPCDSRRLENCHLTEACCKELAVILVVSPRLTHLCLAKNDIGDHGLKTLCEVLHYPYCPLQTLV